MPPRGPLSATVRNGWKADIHSATPIQMFSYDAATFAIVDEERGLLVAQTGGPGHDVFAGLMTSPRSNWSLRFLVSRSSNQYDGSLSAEAFRDPLKLAKLRNADYQVQLHITTYPPTGEWDRQEAPLDLAREVALALETEFYKTEPGRIRSN